MLPKTFIVFFCIHFASLLISLWTRLHSYYIISFIVIFIPLIFLSVYWPMHLRSILKEAINYKNIVSSSFVAFSAIILSNLLTYLIWYLYSQKDDVKNLWSKDFEIAKLILLVNVIIFIVFYFPSIFLIKSKMNQSL